jgi:hypothetical protein
MYKIFRKEVVKNYTSRKSDIMVQKMFTYLYHDFYTARITERLPIVAIVSGARVVARILLSEVLESQKPVVGCQDGLPG